MDKELKCPHCGKVFKIDEGEYAELVQQVRGKEFEKELHDRLLQLEENKKKDEELLKTRIEALNKENISKLQDELNALKNELKNSNLEKELAVKEAVSLKEKEIFKLENELQLERKKIEAEVNRVSISLSF